MDENKPGHDRTTAGGLSSNLLKAKGIFKSFNSSGVRVDILKGIDLDLDKGDTISIVGASGIGKSTLLHILGTLDYPDSGSLFFLGEEVFLYDSDKLARFRNLSIGFVFQFHHLLSEFSAIENSMMPALIQGVERRKAVEAAEEMLIKVGLKERMNNRVGTLSGGEMQRVAIARALHLKPAVLLADEPTGNLDKKSSEQIHDLLMELNQEFKIAMIVVTHNMELASFMSRRLTIYDGRLVETT
jgi:lipoprotein-releasing system ATP-binding protein